MDKFSDLVRVRVDPQTGKPQFALAQPGASNVLEASTKEYDAVLKQVGELMRATGNTLNADTHAMVGAATREPIRTMARYLSWTEVFLEDWPVGWGEDNAIPVGEPLGSAFISSPEGRPQAVMIGIQQFVRPSFYEIKSKLQVHWNTLKTAGWNILARAMEHTADDLARKRDAKRKTILDAAIASVAGHAVTVTGGVWTKSALDNILKTAAFLGFPITQGTINPGRFMDMTNWTNGSLSALPFFWSPPEAGAQVYKTLTHEGYGNVRWRISHSHPSDVIYLGGEASDIGYTQHRGGPETASSMDIDLAIDSHVTRENHGDYVGNPYNLWKITIAA